MSTIFWKVMFLGYNCQVRIIMRRTKQLIFNLVTPIGTFGVCIYRRPCSPLRLTIQIHRFHPFSIRHIQNYQVNYNIFYVVVIILHRSHLGQTIKVSFSQSFRPHFLRNIISLRMAIDGMDCTHFEIEWLVLHIFHSMYPVKVLLVELRFKI